MQFELCLKWTSKMNFRVYVHKTASVYMYIHVLIYFVLQSVYVYVGQIGCRCGSGQLSTLNLRLLHRTVTCQQCIMKICRSGVQLKVNQEVQHTQIVSLMC